VLDHLGFSVSDLNRAKRFYQKALAPLGITLIYEVTPEQSGSGSFLAFGEDERPYFWLGTSESPSRHLHVAFLAKSRKMVDEFHKTALEAGGKDNGAPGLRPQYHAQYYGAFVLDPDGNNIEAVCHGPS
jgi:catechol 2,3-dioxygenase-like lactoylglutathione lyase family enzyme